MKTFIKILAVIAVCILPLFGIKAQITEFPLTEGFEDATFPGESGWTFSSSTNQNWEKIGTSSSGPACSPNSGTGMLYYSSGYNGYSNGVKGLLISPLMKVQGKNLRLSFWMYRDNSGSSYHDLVNIYLNSTPDLSDANLLTTIERNYGFSPVVDVANKWYEYSITLPVFAMTDAYVIFEAVSANGYKMYIDDISISEMVDWDVEVLAITAPVSGINLAETEQVSTTFRNRGVQNLTSVNFKLKKGETEIATETWTGTLASDAMETYTFNATADLSTNGDHAITVEATLAGDGNLTNNSKTITVNNKVCKISDFPAAESFDNTNSLDCWKIANEFSSTYWARNTSGTILSGAGSMKFNSGAGSSYKGRKSWLISPAIDVQGKALRLSFWMHRSTGNASYRDSVNVYLNDTDTIAGASKLTTVHRYTGFAPVIDGNVAGWYEYSCTLPVSAMTTAYVIFEAVDQYGEAIYLDDVSISEILDWDVEVLEITAPVSGNDMSNEESVSITLKNNGENPITSLSLKLEKGGSEIATEAWTGTIASGATETYTFTAKANLSTGGNHEITVTATLASDGNPSNDSKTVTVTNTICKVTEYPLIEGFENNGTSLSSCWTQEAASPSTAVYWQVTEASTGTPNTVHGGTYKARMYGSSRGNKTKLVSPKLDLNGLTSPALYFWHTQKKSGSDQDTLKVYYKTSVAGEWSLLEEYKDDIADWTERKIILPNKSADYYIAFEGTIQFGSGIQLDDIKVFEFADYVDMELMQIIEPDPGLTGIKINLSNNENVKVTVRNISADPIADFGLRLQVNGVTEDSISWAAEGKNPIPVNAIDTFTFSGIDFSANNTVFAINVTIFAPTEQVPENDSKSVSITNNLCETVSLTSNFTESFEEELFPPRCWQSISADNAPWKRVTTGTYPNCESHSGTGTGMLKFECFGSTGYSNGKTGLLVSPFINFDIADKNPKLLFWMYRDSEGSASTSLEKINVYLNSTPDTNGAVLLNTIYRRIDKTPVVSDKGWYEYSELLSGHGINNGYIIFEGVSANSYNIYLDDISIINFKNYVDAELHSIIEPTSGTKTDLSAAETVTVSVINKSSDPLTDFGLKLEVNGLTVDSIGWASAEKAPIASFDTAEFIFQNIDLSANETFTLNASVYAADDQLSGNNSKSVTLTNIVCRVAEFPWQYGFEDNGGYSPCWTRELLTASTNWDICNSSCAYPSTVHGGTSKMRFRNSTQASSSNPNPSARLVSPKFDITGITNPVLSFWYTNTRGNNASKQDTLKVYYKNSTEGEWVLLETFSENITDWQEAKVALLNPTEDYYISFVAVSRGGESIYLDDLSVFNFQGYIGAELIEITKPVAGSHMNLSTEEEVKVRIKNHGSDPLSTFNISLDLNGTTLSEVYAGTPIASLATAEYTLQNKLNLSASETYNITAAITVAGDTSAADDTAKVTLSNTVCTPITAAEWSESFDETTFPPSGCWTSLSFDANGNPSTNTQWLRIDGTGTANPDAGSHSGAGVLQFKSYGSPYTAGTRGVLITPPVNIESRANKAVTVSFWMYRSTDGSQADLVNVYVNNTNSITPDASLLMTINRKTNLAPAVEEAGWYEYSASIVSEEAAVFFIFEAVSAYGYNMYIDDISVKNFENYIDAEVVSINSPTPGIHRNLSSDEQVQVSLKNNSSNPLANFGLRLQINGETVDSIAWADEAIGILETELYTFENIDFSAEDEYNVTVAIFTEEDEKSANDSKSVTFENFICNTVTDLITDFLWVENFDNGTALPNNCWISTYILPEGGSATAWAYSTGGSNPNTTPFGTGMLYFNSANTQAGKKAILITPAISIENRLATLSFYMTRDNGRPQDIDHVNIYVNSAQDIEGATLLLTVNRHKDLAPAEETTGWHEYSVTLPAIASDIYVILEGVSAYGNNIYIDSLTITAVESHSITATAGEGGSISPSGVVPVAENGSQLFTITADDGYKISQVLINDVNDDDAVNTGSYEFTNVTTNHTIEAAFTLKTYTITFDANGGEGTMQPQEFTHGIAQALSANEFSYTGKFFNGWATSASGSASGEVEYADEALYTATADDTLYAVWENNPPVVYNIELSALPAVGGEVSGGGSHNENSEITVRAVPNAGYVFVNWTEADTVVTADADYTFTVTANRSLTANFTFATSVDPAQDMSGIKIYPNPSTGVINVQTAEKSTVKVFNLLGKLMGIYETDANSNIKLRQTTGTYFIHVESKGKVSAHKVIVQ
jgi:hypothetical protein